MVMKKNVMGKNLRQTILKSLGRYIAIVAIIALGAGMFVGLLSTRMDMIATAQDYTDEQNMFDLRLLSTYGWTAEHVDAVRKMEGVSCAEGAISLDVIGKPGDAPEEAVYRLHSIPEEINKVYLLGGRMPQSPDECLVDGFTTTDAVLGTQFEVSATNEEETLDSLNYRTFTVVGYVSSPLYMDLSRGNTTLGSGSLSTYLYIPSEAFSVDYFTEIVVTMQGDYEIYSDAFTEAMEQMAETLEPEVTLLAENRYHSVKEDAESQYGEGLNEYEDGVTEFEDGRLEAEKKLAEGRLEIKKGKALFQENWAIFQDGEKQLADAQAVLDTGFAELVTSEQELANAKTESYSQLADAYAELTENYKLVSQNLKTVEDGLAQMDSGITALEDGLAQIDAGVEQLDLLISVLDAGIGALQTTLDLAQKAPIPDTTLIASLEEQIATQSETLSEYTTQRDELTSSRDTYAAQLADLQTQRATLAETKATLDTAMSDIELGMMELESSQMQADNRFAAAQAQIDSGRSQLEEGQKELDKQKTELEAGRTELLAARNKLYEGIEAYRAGEKEASKELADGQKKLEDASVELAEAKEAIDSMEPAEVYILNRNTNVGYLSVDSSSSIVAGVSRVFPAFFLLVAALVCITTMTRMVDEERTQIGILKALGYNNREIVNKYLFYSGSAAIFGCGLGVIVGSIVFPKILWAAYSVMLNIRPDIMLKFNWPLCIAVVVAYTAVSMLVTWYCCHRELKEVPAELIRPKAPTAGKKIFLEYLPFWEKISFLNKVMFRNVFRYHQRLLMMLVGIGGCTALLLTGFGFRDSIVDIVDYQFAEITVYDMEVYFSEGQTDEEQAQFRQELRGDVDEILFYHQLSGEMDFENQTKEITVIAAEDTVRNFIDFHRGNAQLGMPGVGEAYLTVGAAETMGIKPGDTVAIRNGDMKTLNVTITEIFDNYVQNFVVIRPETIEEQWGQRPEYQMAYVSVRDTQDSHAAGAKIAGMSDVMNVSISQDVADQVGSMLEALDMVVATIVICAGLLAIIVLYNLTNISITERIREIATIKVLGFNAKETALYVFKENLFLTAMGSAIGLVGGIYLLKFVMSQIKIDIVWFTDRLLPMSFVWAVVLTMLSACFVDFLLYFKLEKVNMAEALKSVE